MVGGALTLTRVTGSGDKGGRTSKTGEATGQPDALCCGEARRPALVAAGSPMRFRRAGQPRQRGGTREARRAVPDGVRSHTVVVVHASLTGRRVRVWEIFGCY